MSRPTTKMEGVLAAVDKCGKTGKGGDWVAVLLEVRNDQYAPIVYPITAFGVSSEYATACVGKLVTMTVEVDAREYAGRHYASLSTRAIQLVSGGEPEETPTAPMKPAPKMPPPPDNKRDELDDIPF